MSKTIRITVRDAESQGTDPPLARAVLAQVKDIISLLGNLEKAIFEDGEQRVVWRIAKVSSKSPVQFEIAPAPAPSKSALGFGHRAHKLVSSAAKGIRGICANNRKPRGFNRTVTQSLMRVHKRALSGEVESDVDFSAFGKLPKLSTRKKTVQSSVDALTRATKPEIGPYQELGSFEGYITKVETDAPGRPVLWLRSRIKEQSAKCMLSENALRDIEKYRIRRILRGLLVLVRGVLFYKSLGELDRIEVDRIHVCPPDKPVPSPEEIEKLRSPGITGGLEASEHLRRVWEGE